MEREMEPQDSLQENEESGGTEKNQVCEPKKSVSNFKIDLSMKVSSAYNMDIGCRTVSVKLTDDFRKILNSFAVQTLKKKSFDSRTINSNNIDIVTKERSALKREIANYIEQGSHGTQYILYSLFENLEQTDFVWFVETLIDARVSINVFAHFVKFVAKLAIDREITLSTNIVAELQSENDSIKETNK